MKLIRCFIVLAFWKLFLVVGLWALDRESTEFKIYQFPPNEIPQINGDASDWDQVPDEYAVDTSELWEDSGKHEGLLLESLDVQVKVAWVKGFNRLYFLYEAYDDYWDFELNGLKNDTFELVIDADLSGGPLIDRFRENETVLSRGDAWLSMHGVHAQNYHIFTPARDKDWCMLWGPAQWLKSLPYSNHAYRYNFEPGNAGKLTLEFWVTPFDFASSEGPQNSVQSVLRENALVGISWAIIDYDEVTSDRNNGFWNLSRNHTMYGKANQLVGFRLMPPEPNDDSSLEANWDYSYVDRSKRQVAFLDRTASKVDEWFWDFGDGKSSTEQNPIHEYEEPGHYVVELVVRSGGKQSRFSRVWDVSFK